MLTRRKKFQLGLLALVFAAIAVFVGAYSFTYFRGQVSGVGDQMLINISAVTGTIVYDPGTSTMNAGEQRTIAIRVNIGSYVVDGFQVFADLSGTIPAGIAFSPSDLTSIGLTGVVGDVIDYGNGKRLRILFITSDPLSPFQFSQDVLLGTLSFTVPTSGQMQITTDPSLTKILESNSGVNIAQVPGVQGYTFQDNSDPGSQPAGRARLDYDGDGTSDVGIFAPSNVGWYVQHSAKASNAAPYIRYFGWAGVRPVADGDYDGDGKADIAIYDPVGSHWYIQYSSLPSNAQPFHRAFGWTGVTELKGGDYDGDGKTDIGLYDRASSWWYIQYSSRAANAAPYFRGFGWGGVTPLMGGDYDGDGKTDIGIYDKASSWWYIQYSSRAANAAPYFRPFGWGGVTPLMGGDYDGDGKTDIGIYDQASGLWFIQLSSQGETSGPVMYKFGGPNKVAISGGDYDGDGKTDIVTFDVLTSNWEFLYSSLGFRGSPTRKAFGWRGVIPLGL